MNKDQDPSIAAKSNLRERANAMADAALIMSGFDADSTEIPRKKPQEYDISPKVQVIP